MKAGVFSGTTEGRRFSKKLAELGVAVTVCVATPLGAGEQGEMAGVTVRAGRLQPDAMAALLAGADLCVDATHPYAVDATRNIRAAAVQAGVEYRRLLRAQSPLPPGCAGFETAAQAAEYLAGTEGNILLATGAKELAVLAGREPARLYPRVLPTPEGIAACEAANVPHRNIIAMQGPFSLALNKALITQFQIRYLVTKDGGAAGGFGAGAAALLTARLRPGVEMLLDAADFPRLAADADLIISGEGRLDSQSLGGKAVIGVARRARELRVPCAALAGAVDVSALPRAYELGLTAAFPVNPLPLPFEQVRVSCRENLSAAEENLIRF